MDICFVHTNSRFAHPGSIRIHILNSWNWSDLRHHYCSALHPFLHIDRAKTGPTHFMSTQRSANRPNVTIYTSKHHFQCNFMVVLRLHEGHQSIKNHVNAQVLPGHKRMCYLSMYIIQTSRKIQENVKLQLVLIFVVYSRETV